MVTYSNSSFNDAFFIDDLPNTSITNNYNLSIFNDFLSLNFLANDTI